MRSLVLVSLSLIASVTTPAEARRLDAGVDVCALRPDLCDERPAARRAPRPRGLDAESVSFASINHARPTGASRRPAARAPAGRADSFTRSITCRPPTVEMTSANQNLPECGSRGRSIASEKAANVRQASLSFSSYMNQNATNPALSRRNIGEYQSAFASTAKPATLDVTGLVDGSGVRETAPGPTAANAVPRGNQ